MPSSFCKNTSRTAVNFNSPNIFSLSITNPFDNLINSSLLYFSSSRIIEHLPGEFIRTHRSYIVNMTHIYRITSSTIELSNHLTIQIARSYYKDVINAFAKYTRRFDITVEF
ncbi:LytTR family transcriptional regulator DNA-binding domain-containing protein [Agathobacter rectalis]|uniref:LytTR family transcriptional regulator DNA-binding domain-containing protein n=1 Tax=Agathobacter rectalis TaxID=39491 RepID=UPI0027D2ED93|nr:LytTR family DNA-binding domain-containing protein [Agathobacter rectalis]MCB6951061.1 LytTR family transcriptional regulator [Agathobacter rectalis]